MNLNEFFKDVPKKKKVIWAIFVSLFLASLIAFILYLELGHGNWDLFRWVDYYRLILIVILAFFGVTITLVVLDFVLKSKKNLPDRFPTTILYVPLLIGIIASPGFISYFAIQNQKTQEVTPIQLFMLDGTGANRIPDFAVMYYTKAPIVSELKYGTSIDNLNNTYKDPTATRYHALIMKDLLPETRYFYSIDDGKTIYNFTTFSSTNRTLRFGFSSDPHFGKKSSNRTATYGIFQQAIDPLNALDAFFIGGDFADYGFVDSHWIEGLEYISPYTTQIPFKAIPGNHDSLFGGIELFKDYFYNRNAPLATGTQLYQHITINDIHLFFLDVEWDAGTFDKAQHDWFESELKKLDKNDIIIVFSHAFYYSSGVMLDGAFWGDNKANIEQIVPLFEEYGVDMVFSGHNHHFEHLQKNNVNYYIAGGMGGGPEREPTFVSKASIFHTTGMHGYAEVEISGSVINVLFKTPENVLLYSHGFMA
jgi:hypothetical protein